MSAKKTTTLVALYVALVAVFVWGSIRMPIIRAQNPTVIVDPCQLNYVLKSSVAINQVSATTTQLVAPVSTQSVYVCGVAMTIAPSGTTADTAQFITGSGATCGTSTVTKTGTFGNGDLTAAAPPVFVLLGNPGTTFSAAVGSGVCIVTAGTAVSVQGILTYVQQ